MVRNIEIYNGKYIDVDLDIAKKYIGNIFLIFLLFAIFVLPSGIGKEQMTSIQHIRQICLIVITYFAMLSLIVVKILDKDLKIGFYEIILLIYTILIILSSAFSEYKDNVLMGYQGREEGLLVLIAYAFCFYIVKETFNYNEKIFNLLTVLLLFASCIGLLQALNKTGYEFKLYKEIEGITYMATSNFGNPNMFSGLLSLFLPIYIVKYINTKDNMWLPVLGILFAALVCTKTLGGYITFLLYFVVLFVYFAITRKNKKEILEKFLFLALVFSLVFTILNLVNKNTYVKEFINIEKLQSNKENIDSVIDNNSNNGAYIDITNDKFGTGRGFIWKITLRVIKDHLIFGVGPECLGLEVVNNHVGQPWYTGDKYIDKAHCEYLHIAATTGIPSLIVYLVFIFGILIALLKKYINVLKNKGKNSHEVIFIVAIAASIVSYLFQASANISVIYVAPMFWCMLGVAANICKKDAQIAD